MHMHPDQGVDHSRQAELGQEAMHLHRCLFCREALPSIVADYLQVHVMLPELCDAPPEQLRTVQKIVAARLNAVAIEPWLRRGKRRHALTSKLLLLAYLAECGGQHASLMRHNAGGHLTLLINGLRGGLGLLRGRFLKARHGLL
jgi:hypothetical protein